jgi:hypothetical protein
MNYIPSNKRNLWINIKIYLLSFYKLKSKSIRVTYKLLGVFIEETYKIFFITNL